MDNVIHVWSDGGAQPNPGNGGIGCIIRYKNLRKEISEAYELTTNNRMEIISIIRAFQFLNSKKIYNKITNIAVHSDSKYIINAFQQNWIMKWANNNWKNGTVKNIDLWQSLLEEIRFYNIEWIWTKGHNGDIDNERCDFLATQAINSSIFLQDEGYNRTVL